MKVQCILFWLTLSLGEEGLGLWAVHTTTKLHHTLALINTNWMEYPCYNIPSLCSLKSLNNLFVNSPVYITVTFGIGYMVSVEHFMFRRGGFKS